MVQKYEDAAVGGKKNSLTILTNFREDGQRKVTCLCDCGNTTTTLLRSWYLGETKSCGCLRVKLFVDRNTKHKMFGTKTYDTWESMKARCNNPRFEDYSLRGITYDPRWESFENFYEDMGVCPEGMSLDRIYVNGNYCKENCRWVLWGVQMHNKRKRGWRGKQPSSIFFGVTKNKNRFMARLKFNKELVYSESFVSEVSAAEAYDKQSLKYYGDEPNKELIKEYIENGKC